MSFLSAGLSSSAAGTIAAVLSTLTIKVPNPFNILVEMRRMRDSWKEATGFRTSKTPSADLFAKAGD